MIEEISKALKSALLSPEVAKDIWNDLLTDVPFEQLSDATCRIMPKIYKNLEGLDGVKNYEKLKGNYRFNWTKNSKIIYSFQPILRGLNSKSLNYRILKGAGLNFLNGSLGVRSMGDIDLLISTRDLKELEALFELNGFTKKYDTLCPNSDKTSIDSEICYISPENIEVDVHLAEHSYPQLLFRKMLKTKPQISEFLGSIVLLPAYELALIHSIYHGDKGVQSTDYIQTMVDCDQLASYIDIKFLKKYARALNVGYLVSNYMSELYEVSNKKNQIFSIRNKHFLDKPRYIIWVLLNYLLSRSDLVRIIRNRKIYPRELERISSNFIGKRRIYIFWLKLGKPRPFEKMVCKFLKGFLNNPRNVIDSGMKITGFNSTNDDGIEFSKVPIEASDWRFKIFNKVEKATRDIEITSQGIKEWNWLVFINGTLFGTTTKVDHGTYVIRLSPAPKYVEISLRSPLHVCNLCYKDLSDLQIRIF